jgi:hypothetical protein
VSYRDLELEQRAEGRRSFDAEIRQATRYEQGLAVKLLIALAIVAVLALVRVIGF